ncbi:MAG: choice-of-anchor E domain-containing protein [Caldilineaceae bacterium]
MHNPALRVCVRAVAYLTLLFWLGWSYQSARAETLVYTDTVPNQTMNWNHTLSFPQFDPSLGILTRVDITATGDISGSIGYENFPGTTPISVTGMVNANLNLSLPQNKFILASQELISITESAGVYDGAIDFRGASGATHFYAGTLTRSAGYVQPADLQPYIGTGSLSLPLSAISDWDAGGGSANIVIALRTDGSGAASIRYTYAIPQIAIKKFTHGFDADNPNDMDVPILQPNSVVTWTYRVTNTGVISIPLASVQVTDSQPGVVPVRDPASDVGSDTMLAPGEVWLYHASGVVQDLDTPSAGVTVVAGCNPGGAPAPGNRATYRNIGRVVVPGDSAEDPSHYCNPAEPGIAIKKFTNGFDADNPNDPDVPRLQPGATVTWTYRVTNTGNITFTLATVVVTDSQPGITPVFVAASDVRGDQLLSPGETWTYMATATVQNLDAPSAGTTVVTGCNPNNPQVPGSQPTYFNLGQVTVPGATDSDPSHYCNPPVADIHLEKTVYLGHDGGVSCPGVESVTEQEATPVTYCFEVINTGETYLSNLVFTDTILGIDLSNLIHISGTTPLAPGARILYYYESAIPAGARLNTAQVEGNPTDDQGRDIPELDNPTDDDTAQVTPLPTEIDPNEEPLRKLFLPFMIQS